jgi:hypothetical protein
MVVVVVQGVKGLAPCVLYGLAACAAVLRSTRNDWACKGVGLNYSIGSNTHTVGGCMFGVVCFKLGVT